VVAGRKEVAASGVGISKSSKSSERRRGWSDAQGSEVNLSFCLLSAYGREETEMRIEKSLEGVVRPSSETRDGVGRDESTETGLPQISSQVAISSLSRSSGSLRRISRWLFSRRSWLTEAFSVDRLVTNSVFCKLLPCRRLRGIGMAVACSMAATDGGISEGELVIPLERP
jgi:hypothetical protein